MGVINRLLTKWFELEPEYCESCETLKRQLEVVNFEKKQVLDSLLNIVKPVVKEETVNERIIKPIQPRVSTWAMRRQELERNDKLTADKLKEVEASNEALEKELEVNEIGEESNAS